MKKVVSLKVRLGILICTLLMAQAVLVFVAFNRAKSLLASLHHVSELELPATRSLTYADMMHDGIRAVVLEGLFADSKGEQGKLAEIEKEAKEKSGIFIENIEKLEGLELTPDIKKDLADVKSTVKAYGETSVKVVSLLKTNKAEVSAEKEHFDEIFEKLEKDLEAISGKIEEESKGKGNEGQDIIRSIVFISVLGFLASLFASVIIYFWIRNTFAKIVSMNDSAVGAVGEISKKIAESTAAVASASDEQVASVQESAAALSEMTSMLQQTSRSVKEMLNSSDEAKSKSENGREKIQKLSSQIKEIQDANSKMQEINKMIEEIDSKTNLINNIVFKTQLLSFNASIEAARAGDAGKGFAVVAEEVGSLAEMSGRAALEIGTILQTSRKNVKEILELIKSKVDNSMSVGSDAQRSFVEIVDSVDVLCKEMKLINDAATQQSAGIQQIDVAMKQMDNSSRANASVSIETKEATQELLELCHSLMDVSSQLSTMVNGGKGSKIPKSKTVSAKKDQEAVKPNLKLAS